jgi:MFS family permease
VSNNPPQALSPHDPYAALRVGEFRLFVAGRFLVTIAIMIQSVVVGWQVYDLTKDPLSLGFIGLVEAIPAIGVALYAGHVADLYNRKMIILSCVFVIFLTSLALYLLSLDLQHQVLRGGIWPIYTVIFIGGVARGFVGPAVFSFMSQLLPRELYVNATTWSSTMWQTAAVIGPALGGLINGFFGTPTAYLVSTILVLLALASFVFIASKPLPPPKEGQSLMESLSAGVKFVFGNQIILGALALDLFAVLFGGAVALLPIFASDILKTGSEGLGFLRAAPSVGAVLMALSLAHRPLRQNAGRLLLWSVAGFGVCMILFAVSSNFYFSLFILALSGAFDNISVVIRSTILQLETPDGMRGRVSAVNNIFIGSSNEIGEFESGVMARLMGVIPSVVFGGCMTLVVVGTTAWRAGKLRMLSLGK